MKRYFLALMFLTSAFFANAQLMTPPSGENQKCIVTQYIGSVVNITVTYNSPDVTSPNGESREGKIWGELVPHGFTQQGFGLNNPSPWRAGANENTTIEFSHDVKVQGKDVPAGKYGLFIATAADNNWTLVLSKDKTNWGSYFYIEDNDVLRAPLTSDIGPYQEWLTYEFVNRKPDFAMLSMKWERKNAAIKIEVPNINEIYINTFKEQLGGSLGFQWQSFNTAATFCLNANYDLKQGLEWAEKGLSAPFIGQRNFTTLGTKASILSAMGQTEESDKIMKEALNEPTATVFLIHNYARQLVRMGRPEKALETFIFNKKKHGDVWPVNVGLMRGYSALKEYSTAIKYGKKALQRAPDQLNKDSISKALEMLEENRNMN